MGDASSIPIVSASRAALLLANWPTLLALLGRVSAPLIPAPRLARSAKRPLLRPRPDTPRGYHRAGPKREGEPDGASDDPAKPRGVERPRPGLSSRASRFRGPRGGARRGANPHAGRPAQVRLERVPARRCRRVARRHRVRLRDSPQPP